ncbi:hypothetical protein F0U44_21970 [Nocardioides humilatus]|uniref:Uncharacterized protein n=1 Tax=Nocardioides humilatus TaxID=2607660 RepID=A0A5B1L6E3_9ACTN|nr:hypothetical protein [Nocardioides humilatus]KAA1415349.1 hypothetical protein F0U44_21970 [Nocardioides humilatus]
MFDAASALSTIHASLAAITPVNGTDEIDAATDTATNELNRAAAAIAAFANQLDDGTGFFNSSTEFGRQLAVEFDETRRGSTVFGLLHALSVPEALSAIEYALTFIQVRVGPHSNHRAVLDDASRNGLARIRDTAAEALVDAAMPADPEDEDLDDGDL